MRARADWGGMLTRKYAGAKVADEGCEIFRRWIRELLEPAKLVFFRKYIFWGKFASSFEVALNPFLRGANGTGHEKETTSWGFIRNLIKLCVFMYCVL